MLLEAVQRPLIQGLVLCWCDTFCNWCVKPSLTALFNQVKMGGRKSKIQAENVEEENLSDSSFSVINLHASSATSGALVVCLILGLAIGGYTLAKVLTRRKVRRPD